MIWFTELTNQEIVFQFVDRELPEEIAFPKKTKLHKIEFPGGHQTNQIIGVYRGDLEWSGIFYGMYTDKTGRLITAKQRADQLESLIGRPIRVGFPVGGHGPIPGLHKFADKDSEYKGGYKGVYIIEEFIPRVKNYLHIEYTIKLAPHERQEKIKPSETSDVRVKVVSSNMEDGVNKLKAAVDSKNAKKGPLQKAKAVADANENTNKGLRPSVARVRGKR